jgi:hypothetical protein
MSWDPTALSASAARMVVAAVSTDPSQASDTVKKEVPHLLGGGDRERELLAEMQLDQTRNQLQAAAGMERERARAAQEAVWRTQLADLLEEHDEKTAGDLRTMVDQLQKELRGGMVEAAEKARKRKQWRKALHPLSEVFDWYKVNAFAGILLAAGFVVLKCYVVARGNVTTALGILQYSGLATVVTASLLSSLPILIAAMLAYTVSQITLSLAAKDLTLPLGIVVLGALVLAAVFTPWTYMLFAVVIGLLIGVTLKRGRPTRAVVYGVAVVGTLVAVTVNLSAVWLPHEIVTFPPHTLPAGRTQEVGYVLSEDNGWITVLSTGPGQEHAVIRVPDATVKTQTVCERRPALGHPWSPVIDAYTLWRVVTGANSYLSASVNTTCPYEGP